MPSALSYPIRMNTLIGALLVALGATTMLGWMLQVPAMVGSVHGLLPMVFNTGLAFVLAGIAMLVRGPYGKLLRALIGAILIVLSGLTLIEFLLDADLGIDMAWVHLWHDYGNTRPGRMAPNSALGFMLIGAVNLRLARVETRGAAYTVVLLTFCLLTVGLTGLVGYMLAPDLLFGWPRSARMALHTATGLIAAAIGIWVGWSRSRWFSSARFFTEATKVRFLGTAILIVVTTTVGLTGFVLMQQSLERAIEGRLAAVVQNRGPWLLTVTREIARHARSEMRLVDAHQAAAPLLRGGAGAPSMRAFDEIASRLLAGGYQHIALEDAAFDVVRALGRRGAPPAFSATLDADGTELVSDGVPMLRVRQPILQDGRTIGYLRLDRTLPTLAAAMFSTAPLGATVELFACVRDKRELVCMPNARHTGVFRIDIDARSGRHELPMALATAGRAGVIYTLDYRDRNVVAAYAPIAPGFGFVAKQETVEAYSAIRHALEFGLPIIAAISVFGALALYSQMDPLVSRMHASERRAEAAAAETHALMQAAGEGIMTIDAMGCIRSVNPVACQVFGYQARELEGANVTLLIPPELRAAHQQGLARAAAGKPAHLVGGPAVTVIGLRKDGARFPLELTVTGVMLGAERRFVGVMRDVTERRALEQKLEHLAQYDALTGLANRRLFMERLHTALKRAQRSGGAIAVMFIDLDGFKAINDTLGHHSGDELLVEVAARLKAAVRITDTVARLGGDEFTVLLEDLKTPAEQSAAVAHKILSEMRRAFLLAAGMARIGASVGLVMHEGGAEPADIDDILRQADARMYAAKQAGKDRVVAR